MKWINEDNLEEFEEEEHSDVRILRTVIKLMKAKIEELEEEVEDVKLEMKEIEIRSEM